LPGSGSRILLELSKYEEPKEHVIVLSLGYCSSEEEVEEAEEAEEAEGAGGAAGAARATGFVAPVGVAAAAGAAGAAGVAAVLDAAVFGGAILTAGAAGFVVVAAGVQVPRHDLQRMGVQRRNANEQRK
jgi:hypothetical protein